MVHIYTAEMQPATGYLDQCGDIVIRGGWEPDAMILCECCGKRYQAKDCVVQCYYDGLKVWCAHEKGCKDPEVIAAKKAQEFANRSAGQKRRWAKQ